MLNYHFSKVLFILMIINLIINLNSSFLTKILKNFVFVSFCLTSIFLYVNAMNWQIKTTKLETDLWPVESKKILNWINLETPKKSTLLTLDPFLLRTIPTLSGRYNYIPSLDTLTPTSINSPIAALSNAKKILGLSDEFDKFLNSSCKKHTKLDLESFCHYTFYSYFTLDKGSFSYLKRSKTIPKNLFIPEKNREGKRIIFTQVDLKNNITNNKDNYTLPEYIIIGPVEKEFINNENYSKFYQEVFSTENYQILKVNN